MNSKSREEWDLNHPNDEMPTKLGIDGQYIPERYIPFDSSTLETFNIITNEDGESLIYYKEDKSYKMYDNDPYTFLANPFKKWGKLEYPKTSDQSLSTTGDVKLGGELHQNTTLSTEQFNKMKAEQIMYNICMDKLLRGLSDEGFKVEVWNPISPEIMAKLQDEEQGTYTTITNMTRGEIKEKYDVDIPDDRYFTPSIEDIHVGYECEIGYYTYEFPNGLSKSKENWEHHILNSTDVSKLVAVKEILDGVKTNDTIWVRVPYLTKEQIEKEGWVSYQGSTLIALNKGDFYIWYSEFSKILSIDQGKHPNKRTRFIGECKDINTFRKICKLLNI